MSHMLEPLCCPVFDRMKYCTPYHGSGLWYAHFAHNQKAIRNFLIHMEGLRKKCQSKNFSPLAELQDTGRVLVAASDNAEVYGLYNMTVIHRSNPVSSLLVLLFSVC